MKNKAKQFAFKTKGPHDIAAHKSLKNKLKTSIHEAKLSYVKLLVQESKRNPVNCGIVIAIIGRSKSRDSVISASVSPDSVIHSLGQVILRLQHMLL